MGTELLGVGDIIRPWDDAYPWELIPAALDWRVFAPTRLAVLDERMTALIGRRLGARRFDQWVRRFGFGTPTGVDLPGEEAGIVLKYDDYSGSTAANMAMGQGLAVTPMQMATAYAGIANGGILRPAHMIESVGDRPARKPAGHRVISEATASSIRRSSVPS